MAVFLGDDWAEAHHDIHLMNEAGELLKAKRLPEGIEGISALHAIVAEHASDPSEVIVGIETERGMWVQALIAVGYRVYAINPLSVSRYRDRHNVAGAKSDPGDAKVLADLVRTDRHNHRPVAGDSAEVDGLKILARAHQNLIWDRARHTNRLRNDLREFFPAALLAFEDLDHRDAVAVLAKTSNPEEAARLSVSQIRSALRKGGRQRNLDRRAQQIQVALRTPHLAAPPAVTAAFATTTRTLIDVIGGLNTSISELETELATHFEQHPETTPNATPTPSLAETTPAHHQSPSHQARNGPSWHATSVTGASTTPATNGPSVRCEPAPAAGPSMTNAEPLATSTTKPYAP